MSHSSVCAACRVQNILRRQSYLVYRQRKYLSQSFRKVQDPIERAFAGEPLNNSNARDGRRVAPNDETLRGRYSRQPLAPQHLLDDLNKPVPGAYAVSTGDSNGNSTIRHQASETASKPVRDVLKPHTVLDSALPSEKPKRRDGTDSERPHSIPPKLWMIYQWFCHASKPSKNKQLDEHRILAYLQTIGREYKATEGLRELGRLQTFRRRCYFWLNRICDKWAKELTSEAANASHAVRPSEALSALSDCFSDNHAMYPSSLWRVAVAVAELHAENSERYQERTLDGTRELMRLWNISMAVRASYSDRFLDNGTIEPDWHFLPDVAVFTDTLQRKRRTGGATRLSFQRALQMLVPETNPLYVARATQIVSGGSDVYDYPSSAVLTMDLLQQLKVKSGGNDAVKGYEPWMNLMYTTFKSVGDLRIPFALAQKVETSNMEEPYRGVVQRLGLRHANPGTLKRLQHEVSQVETSSKTQHLDGDSTIEDLSQGLHSLSQDIEEPAIDKTSSIYRFVGTCIKRLGRAVEQQDLTAAQAVLKDVRAFGNRNPQSPLPADIYESLLYNFLSLRNPQLALSVWNDMIKAGHQPNTKTYTIMMRGSQNVRRQDAMEQFWNQMRRAGLNPDRYAWTTRIFGLLRSPAHVDLGLKAMAEMGQEWIAAAKSAYAEQRPSSGRRRAKDTPSIQLSELLASFEGDVNGVPRPDVAVMNAAISALAERNDSLIPRAVSWGRSFGIDPDLTTYNVLINISMRRGLLDEALNILQRMKDKGIEANSTTWTVLLAAMFEGPWMDNIEGEEAAERILSFVKRIDEMEGKGLDEKGHALLIDRLLKVHNSPSAAQKVLNHMAEKGLKPHTHLYTILMSSYFQQSPPNFAAAESLWARIQSENAGYGAVLDNVFYDRMIEAYATHHTTVGTKPMLSYLEKMEAQGKKPSWRALEHAARALSAEGEWERLAQIVESARRERDGGSDDKKGFGQKAFWQFVKSVGMSFNESSRFANEVLPPHRESTHRENRGVGTT